MYHSLNSKAIFVADSHFNVKNQEFLVFLKKLENSEIKTNQLILMGDNFDFLSGESRYFIQINKKVIELLNSISKSIEIIYLEGNHDYNLKDIFPNIEVIKRQNQPFFMQYEDKHFALAHGDNFINKSYDIYCKIIRNSFFLKFLNTVDINFWLSKKIEKELLKKEVCHKIENFEQIVKKRVQNYDADVIVEGHYHQGVSLDFIDKRYINIPSLCCSKEYMVFDNKKFEKIKL